MQKQYFFVTKEVKNHDVINFFPLKIDIENGSEREFIQVILLCERYYNIIIRKKQKHFEK